VQLLRAKIQAAKTELIMRERMMNQAQLAHSRLRKRITELEGELNVKLANAEFSA